MKGSTANPFVFESGAFLNHEDGMGTNGSVGGIESMPSIDPKDMSENGKHCSKGVGHTGTTVVECIAWERGWESIRVRRMMCDWYHTKSAKAWS